MEDDNARSSSETNDVATVEDVTSETIDAEVGGSSNDICARYVEKQDLGKFKCSLCIENFFVVEEKAKSHVSSCHFGCHVVVYEEGTADERTIPLCKKGCVAKAHHHCFKCGMAMRRSRLESHISKCGKSSQQLPREVSTNGTPLPKRSKVEEKVKCDQCNEVMYRRNLNPHKANKHAIFKKNISSKRYHNGICIDANGGVYLMNESGYSGLPNPIHVQKKVVGEQVLQCASEKCARLRCVAGVSSLTSFECSHLQSVAFINSHAENVVLDEVVIDALIAGSRVKEESKGPCMQWKRNAEGNQEVFAAAWIHPNKVFISIWTGEVNSWTQLGRVLVTYDPLAFTLTCCCSHSTKIGCLHKTVSKWYLKATMPETFSAPHPGAEKVRLRENHQSSEMAQYVYTNKRIPYVLPESCLAETCALSVICPHEDICCGTKLLKKMVSQKGQVYSRLGIKSNISVWSKRCSTCDKLYWYNEIKEGIFNHDNHTFLTLDLLEWLRNAVYEHTAIGREVSALNGRYKCKMDADVIRKAFFKYVSLLELDKCFNCVLCGHHPVILTFDAIRKTSFRLSQLDDVEDREGVVNCQKFWDDVNLTCLDESIGGVTTGKIQPSLGYWPPFIPESTRGETVYSTEHLKGTDNTENEYLRSISEEHLEDLFNFADLKMLKEVCESCGISTRNKTKGKLIEALKSAVESFADIDKLFFKIWQGSGGTMTATCPHGVTYAFKCLLKAESSRDVRDILISLRYPPNVVISDVPHLVTSIVNRSVPNFFMPHNGCVAEPTESNIDKVKKGRFEQLSFPNLNNRFEPARSGLNLTGSVMHPITLLTRRWSLYDKFHQGNSKDPTNVMRRTELIKELNGVVTETAEQLNNFISRKTYFLDSMSPIHHQLMLKLVLAERNNRRNEIVQKDIESLLQFGSLAQDEYGRLCIKPGSSASISDESLGSPASSSVFPPSSQAGPSTHFDTLGLRSVWCSPPYLEMRTASIPNHAPFSFDEVSMVSDINDLSCLYPGEYLNGPVMDMLLFCLASEFFKDGIRTVILTECILPRIEQDATLETMIPNCSGIDFLVSASYYSHHWALVLVDIQKKYIYYLDPKVGYMPQEKIMQDLKVIQKIIWFNVLENERDVASPSQLPGWKVITRSTFSAHHRKNLPAQENSIDCGVYVIMYFLYIVRNADFDFSNGDVGVIRQWLGSLLIKNSYEDMSPYIWWFMPKLQSRHFGTMKIKDARLSNEIKQLEHFKRWIEENITMFSSPPKYPTLLNYSEEEQRQVLEELSSGDSYVNHIPKMTFHFLKKADFLIYMDFVNLFGWIVNVMGGEEEDDESNSEITIEFHD